MNVRTQATSKTTAGKRENLASKAQKPAFSPSTHSSVDQILHLQRTIGNQAVQQLLKSGFIRAKLKNEKFNDKNAILKQKITTVPTAMTRIEFEKLMKDKYKVQTIAAGTFQQQNTEVNGLLNQTTWKSWDPGSSSNVYQYIVDAFDDFANVFNAIPKVKEIYFFNQHYEVSQGKAVANPDAGASYAAGIMNIYKKTTTAIKGLPIARSSSSGQYPNVATLTYSTPSTKKGAPFAFPTQKESIKRLITHELGHGVAEAAITVCGRSAPHANMINDFKKTIGWNSTGSKLYDIGNTTVQNDLKNNKVPDPKYEITGNNWNDPNWIEQPLSQYMVSAPAEDFAESVMAFVEGSALLASRSPRRYNFIDRHKDLWKQCMLPIHPVGDFPLPTEKNIMYA